MEIVKAFEAAGYPQAFIVNRAYRKSLVMLKVFGESGWTYIAIDPAKYQDEVTAWARQHKETHGKS